DRRRLILLGLVLENSNCRTTGRRVVNATVCRDGNEVVLVVGQVGARRERNHLTWNLIGHGSSLLVGTTIRHVLVVRLGVRLPGFRPGLCHRLGWVGLDQRLSDVLNLLLGRTGCWPGVAYLAKQGGLRHSLVRPLESRKN